MSKDRRAIEDINKGIFKSKIAGLQNINIDSVKRIVEDNADNLKCFVKQSFDS